MPFLPDLAFAGGIALAVFLVALGLLVVFTDSLDRRVAAALILVGLGVAAVSSAVGELGIALVAAGFAGAVAANALFEWLTSR